jgi:hypothetical protein
MVEILAVTLDSALFFGCHLDGYQWLVTASIIANYCVNYEF